jgi:hypothetical protein
MDIRNGVLLDFERILRSDHDRHNLRPVADAAMRQPVLSVTQKPAPPPGGSMHDFFSLGPYWWPDPTKPDGLPYLRRDGEVNPEYYGEGNDRTRLEKLTHAVRPLAVAALVMLHAAYARRIATLIRTWFLDPATAMTPHLRFGQAIPGRCDGRGIGIIDTRFFVELIDAALIAHRLGAFDEIDHLRTWFGRYLDWLLTHPYGVAERKEHNNHGTWFDVQAAAYALFAGRPDVAHDVLASVPAGRIEKHVEPDGRQPHELARTRSFTYSCVNLEGLFWLGWLGRHVDVDLWRHDRLRAAIDYLAAYADPATPWPGPELRPEPHLPLPRARLTPLLLQAARAWNEPRYRRLADLSGGDDPVAKVCWG